MRRFGWHGAADITKVYSCLFVLLAVSTTSGGACLDNVADDDMMKRPNIIEV
jgi:hypothetical protein